MILLFLSAAFVGLVHSLTPGHWLPVVLMAKTQRWPLRTALLGAAITASGHILISIALGVVAMWVGVQFLSQNEGDIERYSGALLGVFGLIYAAVAYYRHASCIGHTHHGPDPKDPKSRKAPFVFLFSLGFSPCVAVLPIFAAAAPEGSFIILGTMISFALGVLTALLGATVLVSQGLMKLDHPIFEHYGDVIAGLGVALMGVLLFALSH